MASEGSDEVSEEIAVDIIQLVSRDNNFYLSVLVMYNSRAGIKAYLLNEL